VMRWHPGSVMLVWVVPDHAKAEERRQRWRRR
jgi:hypothetical protein